MIALALISLMAVHWAKGSPWRLFISSSLASRIWATLSVSLNFSYNKLEQDYAIGAVEICRLQSGHRKSDSI